MTDQLKFRIIDYQELLSSYGEDLDLIPDLIDTFLEHSSKSLSLIKAAVASQDPEELTKTAHALKSMVSNFYAGPVRDVLIQLEKKGQENTLDGVSKLLSDLEKLFENLKTELVLLQRTILAD